jgi:hypothetical protein
VLVIAAITGGRDYALDAGELRWLVRRCAELGITILRHGDALGVDRRGGAEVGRLLPGVLVQTWPAQWRTQDGYNPRAGFERNAQMLLGQGLAPVDVLLAFPGGKGTAHCVRTAQNSGITVEFAPTSEV